MRSVKIWICVFWFALFLSSCKDRSATKNNVVKNTEKHYYQEPYRPQFHFSPEKMWMNDPNGMVYNQGIYHLFYQYYPDSTVWGPMHWGHATSKDLLHWQHKPIALYPDKNGYIFSGSAVLDKQNSSGFGTDENPPLVAVFTYHDAKKKANGDTDYETQGIAYSLDNGDSWSKYEENPVVSVKNSTDFRDPKVFWYETGQKWIMSLVAGDHAEFYGSGNLKEWEFLGDFGRDQGAHGGVWECPDLVSFKVEGTDEEKWVLFISINPGAPNGGSGTQYFVGDFDGENFTTEQSEERWIDWGTDNYAGVTYSNTPDNAVVFLGWMSNWQYAGHTPTNKWRSAMTVPRTLTLVKHKDAYVLRNYPIENMDVLVSKASKSRISVAIDGEKTISTDSLMQSDIRFTTSAKNFKLTFKNGSGEALVLSMNGDEELFGLDRSNSGKIDFQEVFGKRQQMPVSDLPDGPYEVRMLLDKSSLEVFIDKGRYAMTAQVFPNKDYTIFNIENTSKEKLEFEDFGIGVVNSIW